MRKGAKKMIGHKFAVGESQNDEVMAESLETSTQEVFPPLRPHKSQPQEEVAKEKDNGEEDGEKNKEEEPAKPDSLTQEDEANDASPCQQQVHDKAEEVGEDKKKPARRGGNRKRTTRTETENKDEKIPAPKAKKARQEEPEYLEENRNLQDLWKAAFPVGAEWKLLDALYEPNWDFKHLEEALEEGGMLYGKKVFVFVNAEPQFVLYKDVNKVVLVPTVVVVESPLPPSDKIAITSIQRAAEEIVPMKQMKMDWVPYIPFEKRDGQVDRLKFQIFILVCTQRRAALRHLKEERVRMFDYCLPYFYDPFKEGELEQSTEVQILFPSEPPVVCEFDWEENRLKALTKNLIEEHELSADQEDEFKGFVREQVQAAKKARQEAIAARMKTIEEMSQDARQAFESIKLYKFYPQPPSDISGLLKLPIINRYYGNAHQVFF